MPDMKSVMSGLEGLTEYDWRMYHSDSEVRNIAKDALATMEEQEEKIKNRDESLEKAREEIKWLREMLKEQEAFEPKTGHWIYKKYDDMFMCSSCEKYSIRNDYPYCHWCGAKMKQEGR